MLGGKQPQKYSRTKNENCDAPSLSRVNYIGSTTAGSILGKWQSPALERLANYVPLFQCVPEIGRIKISMTRYCKGAQHLIVDVISDVATTSDLVVDMILMSCFAIHSTSTTRYWNNVGFVCR